MSSTPPPADGPSEHASHENLDVDIPDVDISQPDNSPLYLKLNIPHHDNSANSDPNLSPYVDSDATPEDELDTPPKRTDVVTTIEIPQLQTAQQYIDLLHAAALDLSSMQANDINDLRNPGKEYTLVDLSPLLCSVHHFTNNSTSSRKHYEVLWAIERLHSPDDPLLTFDQVK